MDPISDAAAPVPEQPHVPGPRPPPETLYIAPPQNVNVGVMNSRATSLPKPAYPPIAKQMNASGEVTVQVSIDEEGNVLAAKAVSGPFVLRASAESAAPGDHASTAGSCR